MQKTTQEEYDKFKLRVINSVMQEYKEMEKEGCKANELHPCIYLKPFNKKYKIANLPPELFGDERGKDLVVDTIKDMIKLSESPIMCFVTEAWQARAPKNADPNNLPRPSQLPEDQRQEVVFLNFEAKGLKGYTLSFLKEKQDNGKFKLRPHPINQEINKSPDAKAEGRFSNFYTN